MKKFLIVFLSLFLLISMTACSKTMSEKDAVKNVETALGDYKQLPIDLDQVKDKLGDNTLEQTSDPANTANCTDIIVGNDVVLYQSVIENTAETAAGQAYRFVINIMHIGGAEEKKEYVYNMHFIGANIKMDIEADDPAAVRQELLGAVEQMDLSENDLALMKKLINGKQIFVANDSQIWDMYAEVDTDVEITYDTESESFLAKIEDGYDEMYDQYSYDIVDFKGRVKERVYYKVNEDGTEWITENYHYTYLPDGTLKEHSVVYYDYTTQVWMENEHIEFPDTTWRTLWSRSYNPDGVLENEMYFDESGNQVGIEYFSDGSVYTKRILADVKVDGDTGREIYSEEYGSPGILWCRYMEDDKTATREYYYANGCLDDAVVWDLTKQTDEGYARLLAKKGFEDGSVDVYTYHENGEWKTRTKYSPTGEVIGVDHFDENGNLLR